MSEGFYDLLQVSYHVAPSSGITWYPWTNSENTAIGWRGVPHRGTDELLVWLEPDTKATTPTVEVWLRQGSHPPRRVEVIRFEGT